MRSIVVFVALAGCGRLGFDERIGDGDGGSDGGDATDAMTVGFSHLVAYADSTCALYKGAAYCWGDNATMQLGNGTAMNAPVPTAVQLPAGTVDDLAIGLQHGCAIVSGQLYCYGTQGTGGAVTPISLQGTTAKVIRNAHDFSCAIGANALVYCWGATNSTGQQCVGDTNPRPTPTQTLLSTTTELWIGDDHGCALQSGTAVCWGHNDFGTFGTGTANPPTSSSPVAVTGSITVLPHIAGWHACYLEAGHVRCWGEGDHGENGDGMMLSYNAPTQIPTLSSIAAITVGGGPADLDASCAITQTGGVMCWGNGSFGRLGQGMATNSAVPVAVVGLPGPAVEIALGYAHGCAILTDGNAWCWGRGVKGQLGNGMSQNSLAPVLVTRPP